MATMHIRWLLLIGAALLLSSLGRGAEQESSSEGLSPREQAAKLRGEWNRTLKSVIAGSDKVEVVVAYYRKDEAKTFSISDPAVIRGLIDSIQVEEDHTGAFVGCLGRNQYRFFRGDESLATVSEMCGCLFWPDGPWVGTPPLTAESQDHIAKWVDAHVPKDQN